MPRETGVAPTKKRRPPGPTGTSCLTCKRRRKKCDRTRPKCERCVKTGYECQGYDHIQGDPSGSSIEVPPESSGRAEEVRAEPSHSNRSSLDLLPEPYPIADDSQPDFTPLIAPPQLFDDEQVGDPFDEELPSLASASSLENQFTLAYYGLTNSPDSLADWSPPPSSSLSTISSPEFGSDSDSPQQSVLALTRPWYPTNSQFSPHKKDIPRGLSPVPPDALSVINFILHQYERLFSLAFFRPSQIQVIMHIRGKVVDRISKASTPDISRWTMLLGANIISSFLDGNLPQKAGQYKLWIERFEKELDATPVEELDSTQVQGRYTDTLELAFFKLRLSDRENPYKILRQMVPTFLQIAFSVSSLWESQLDPTSVSVAGVLASERGELAHFLLMDILCSMIYGVPQVLEYDTSAPPRGIYKYPIHGCPAEFQIILAEINARCARCSIADDWQAIEQRLLDWTVPFFDTEGPEPWRAIAQLAVQECWRQALLIYLYMGVCGVSSHDSRVQLCVRQTFQLISTVKKTDPAHPHFMVQFIIAGACTRHEAHRTLARARLSDMSERGMWLMAGSDFVPVLDHLWHGAAANGRAIQWSDYLASRQIALPLNE